MLKIIWSNKRKIIATNSIGLAILIPRSFKAEAMKLQLKGELVICHSQVLNFEKCVSAYAPGQLVHS
jgi:hypothetical protein